MDSHRIDILVQEADQWLASAQAEMLRSEADAVTHTVCFKSRQAIINYLTAFLLSNEVRLIEPETMDSLLEQCRAVDGRFDLVDLSDIHCRFETTHRDYCLDVDQVDQCLRIGRQIKEMIDLVAPEY